MLLLLIVYLNPVIFQNLDGLHHLIYPHNVNRFLSHPQTHVKIIDVGRLDRGVSKNRPRNAPELLGGKYPLIQTGDIANSGIYIIKYNQTYSELGLKQSKMWPIGTLCITIAANIAKTGILTFKACFPDSVVGFTPNNKVRAEYVLFWMSFLQKMLEDRAPESAQKNINLEILRNLTIPLPPIEKQNNFFYIVNKIEQLKAKMQASQQELDNLFNTLMQKAFKGELIKFENVKSESKIKNKTNPFFYIQILGAIIDNLDKEEIKQGEMVIAKYLYLIDRLYKINTKFQYKKWHFGPYDPEIKKYLNNKMYFKKEGKKGFEYFTLTQSKKKLLEKKYKETREIENKIPLLINLFPKNLNFNYRSHKIELLATIGKIMEDSKTTDFNIIRNEMKKWDVKRDNYKNKADVFSEEETKKCIEFIVKNKWDGNFMDK